MHPYPYYLFISDVKLWDSRSQTSSNMKQIVHV
jgi:hypothetical protein